MMPALRSYAFPHEVLTEGRLADALDKERVGTIRAVVEGRARSGSAGISFGYQAPWADPAPEYRESVDLLLSQAVLEHVDDLPSTYEALARWVRPGGVMSHQIDFRSHGMSDKWDGHRRYGDRRWRVARGRRPYLLNRQPLSAHLELLQSTGFIVVEQDVASMPSSYRQNELARRFRALSPADMTAAAAYLLSVRSAA